jgi:hypothetical protein
MRAPLEDRGRRRRKKKAAAALIRLLKRLRSACGKMETLNDWYKLAGEANEVVQAHQDVIPAEAVRGIQDAMKLSEATMAGANRACQVLQGKVGAAIAAMPAAGGLGLGTVLAGAVIAVAAVVFALAALGNLLAVDIRILNQGCSPFSLATVPFLDNLLPLVGIELADEPILDGASAVVSLPPLVISLDNSTDGATFALQALSLPAISVGIGPATDILYDGRSLLGSLEQIDLGQMDGREEHELVIRCTT